MPIEPQKTIYYRKSRFSTRLPDFYLYSPSHYWLRETAPRQYRVGLTRFATRMLGDFVEMGFEIEPGDNLIEGEPIGWIEGFKALSDIYSVSSGSFHERNVALDTKPDLMDLDPYDQGWLYLYNGDAPSSAVNADGYVSILDATIDKMLESQQKSEKEQC